MMIRAKRSFGQNFLRDATVVARIVESLDLTPNDRVIEIGPGHGALTGALLEKADDVTAIELDNDLIEPLKRRFGGSKGFRVVHADALDVNWSLFADGSPIKLAANLPYNVSTPILQRLIASRNCFERLVLMFQREVAERISAPPNTKERGFLTVLAQDAFEVERLFDVPPAAFTPVPKVWSSVVRLRPRNAAYPDADSFRRLVSIGFGQRRKTLANNLKAVAGEIQTALREADIDNMRRAESLEMAEWYKLAGLVRITDEPGR